MTYRIPVEELSYGVLDAKPVDTDWDTERLMNDDWSFWEAKERDIEGTEYWFIVHSGSRIAAMFTEDGLRIGMDYGTVDLDSIECLECDGTGSVLDLDTRESTDDSCPDCDGTGNQAKLTDDAISEINGLDAYEMYAEGPMMNYRYPIGGDSSDSIGGYQHRADAIETAYKLRRESLIVVEYDGEIALALTGGGMDMTWHIVEAFTLIGYMPPVHFCDLPKMAGYPNSDDHTYMIAAVERSLTAMVEKSQNELDRHRTQWAVTA